MKAESELSNKILMLNDDNKEHAVIDACSRVSGSL